MSLSLEFVLEGWKFLIWANSMQCGKVETIEGNRTMNFTIRMLQRLSCL